MISNVKRRGGAVWFLTSNWWADKVGDGMEEVDHTQRRGQVLSSHQVWRHHGDQCHVSAVKVPVEDGEGHKERKGQEQRREEAAETIHRHRNDVTQQTVRLQTSEGQRDKFTLSTTEWQNTLQHDMWQEGSSPLKTS